MQRDRDAGEYVPPNFDSILRSLDDMSAGSEDVREIPGELNKSSRMAYRPGREEFEVLKAYNSLIEAGGRPVCTLGETTHVSKHPGRYRPILGPWVTESSTDSALNWQDIFQQQLASWLSFKAWQRRIRSSSEGIHGSTEDKNDDDRTSRFLQLEVHVESARQSLKRCGINKTFSFDMDTEMQDEWTTWIEYLSFECYCFDLHSQYLGCYRRKYLPKIMIPGEKPAGEFESPMSESVLRDACIPNEQLSKESTRNRRQLKPMENYAKDEKRAVNSSGRSSSSNSTNTKTSHHAQTRLWPPEDSRRNVNMECLTREKHAVEHHTLIIWWALLQEPKIAAASVNTRATISQLAAPLCRDEGSRLKRQREGPAASSTIRPPSRAHMADGLTETQSNLANKRRRK